LYCSFTITSLIHFYKSYSFFFYEAAAALEETSVRSRHTSYRLKAEVRFSMHRNQGGFRTS